MTPHELDPDDACIAAYLEGDQTAFARLVARYEQRLLSFATKLIGDYVTAQDIVQEAFVAAATSAESRSMRFFRSWLFRIAYFKCLRVRHDGKRRPVLPRIPIGPGREPVDPKSTLRPIENSERATRLGELLDRMSAPDRAVLELKYIEGFSTKEIAAATGARPDTVRKRLYRLRMTIVDLFESDPREQGKS